MSTFLASAVAAVLAGAVSAGLSHYISRRNGKSKDRKIVVRSASGKTDVLTVPSGANAMNIDEFVMANVQLELDIAEKIKELEGTIRNFEVHRGKVVDLVATHEHFKIAIEVKSSLDNVNLNSIHRYLGEEGGIERLLLVSSRPAPSKLLDLAGDLISSGRVSIIKVDPKSSSDGARLNASVREALHVPQA